MTNGVATSTAPTVGELSIQAGLEQLEGAIADAHGHLNQMVSRDVSQPESEAQGLAATLDRCRHEMADLNERLAVLAARVGIL